MHDALGFPPPDPDEHPRSDELDMLPAMSLALAARFDPVALIGLMRVYADSLRRITRTETQLWHDSVDVPAQRAGRTQREVMDGGEAFGEAVMPMMDRTLLSLYHRFQEGTWMDDLVEHVELAIEEAGLLRRLERPPRDRVRGPVRVNAPDRGARRRARRGAGHGARGARAADGHGGSVVRR